MSKNWTTTIAGKPYTISPVVRFLYKTDGRLTLQQMYEEQASKIYTGRQQKLKQVWVDVPIHTEERVPPDVNPS